MDAAPEALRWLFSNLGIVWKQAVFGLIVTCARGKRRHRHEVLNMHKQVEIALADPLFDPQRQISRKFFWIAERGISAGLTCNIGME
jgi:hypothetical protein